MTTADQPLPSQPTLPHVASPEYIRTRRSGLSLILNSILAAICFGVSFAFLSTAAAWLDEFAQFGSLIAIASGVLSVSFTVAFGLGYWRFTHIDERSTWPDSDRPAARHLRTFSIVFMALSLVSVAVGFILVPLAQNQQPAPAAAIGMAITNILGLLMFAALMSLTARRLIPLARRVPDAKLTAQATRNV